MKRDAWCAARCCWPNDTCAFKNHFLFLWKSPVKKGFFQKMRCLIPLNFGQKLRCLCSSEPVVQSDLVRNMACESFKIWVRSAENILKNKNISASQAVYATNAVDESSFTFVPPQTSASPFPHHKTVGFPITAVHRRYIIRNRLTGFCKTQNTRAPSITTRRSFYCNDRIWSTDYDGTVKPLLDRSTARLLLRYTRASYVPEEIPVSYDQLLPKTGTDNPTASVWEAVSDASLTIETYTEGVL